MKKLLMLLPVLCLIGTLFVICKKQQGTTEAADSVALIPRANVPRNETIILEMPSGRGNPADSFNRWSS